MPVNKSLPKNKAKCICGKQSKMKCNNCNVLFCSNVCKNNHMNNKHFFKKNKKSKSPRK